MHVKLALGMSLLASFVVYGQKPDLKFKHLTTNDGLSQSTVSAILKDQTGFMWFGTREGLNRYDGYEFKVYKHDDEDETSIGNSTVQDLLEDKQGNIIIATNNGFDRYDKAHDRFTHYALDGSTVRDILQDNKGNIWFATERGICLYHFQDHSFERFVDGFSNIAVNKMEQDDDGDLWIATENGLMKFNPDLRSIKIFKHDPNDKRSIAGNNIKTLFKDHDGNIWVGTLGNGVSRYNKLTNTFVNFFNIPGNDNSLCYDDVLSLCEDDQYRIWAGTENGGITIIDYQQNAFYCYVSDVNNASSLNNNSIYALYKDDIGNMWVGTYAGGINFLPKFGDKFRHYKQVPNSNNTLSSSNVLSISGDSEGYVWIGTDGYGLNLFNPKARTFKQFHHDPDNRNTINSDVIFTVVEVDKETVAIAYLKGGFDLYNKRTERFEHHMPEPGNENSLSHIHVLAACMDSDNQLWLGTAGGGLDCYNVKSKQYVHYRYNPDDEGSISSNVIISFYIDKKGNLWIGTDAGLNMLNRATHKFIRYQHDGNNKQSIGNNVIFKMLEDRHGNLWVGTLGGGLNLLNPGTKNFTIYTEKNGLPNNTIYGILEDDIGNLWLSTNKGISQFNTTKKTFRNYGVTDGLQGNEFKPNAVYKAGDGEMFFGGPNGFNAFYPGKIKDNPFIPPVVITQFQIFNKTIETYDEKSVLHKYITFTRSITLSYKQSVFSFQYGALNYTLPEKNQYAYKLEGFDSDWNYVKDRRSVTYTNLDAGHYVFHVKGSNNDGIWNEKGTAIEIHITPPFWKTKWFISMITFLSMGSIVAYFRYHKKKAKKQADELKRIIETRTDEVKKQTAEIVKKNEREKVQNWITEGAAQIGEIMSKYKGSLAGLAKEILKHLAQYTQAMQGTISVLNNDEPADEHLVLVAKYGVNPDRLNTTRIEIGEGMIGEAFRDKTFKVVDNLPANYIRIESGLGGIKPANLVLLPLKTDEGSVMGVIELAYMMPIDATVEELLKRVSAIIALSIHAATLNSKTTLLLQHSKAQTEELRAQEEEMRQNMEELEATQEEFKRRELEYQSEIQQLRNRLSR